MSKICPLCNNKRHIFQPGVGWVRCKCVDQLRADSIMQTSGFPQALCTIESESFKPGSDPNRKALATAIANMVKSYDKKPCFIYSMDPDKDRVAAIICRYLSILHPEIKSIGFATIDQLVQKSFGKDTTLPFDDINSVDLAVVSIGSEITNKGHQNLLYKILYDRILSERFIIITSSIPKNRILQVYHKAVDSLMENNFNFYEC